MVNSTDLETRSGIDGSGQTPALCDTRAVTARTTAEALAQGPVRN